MATSLHVAHELFLDNNLITDVPEWLGDLTGLTTLRLNDNLLARFQPRSAAWPG